MLLSTCRGSYTFGNSFMVLFSLLEILAKQKIALFCRSKTGRTCVRGTTCIREISRTHPMLLHRAPITVGKPLQPTNSFSRKLRDDLGRASRELTPTVPSLGIRLSCLLLPFIACTISC